MSEVGEESCRSVKKPGRSLRPQSNRKHKRIALKSYCFGSFKEKTHRVLLAPIEKTILRAGIRPIPLPAIPPSATPTINKPYSVLQRHWDTVTTNEQTIRESDQFTRHRLRQSDVIHAHMPCISEAPATAPQVFEMAAEARLELTNKQIAALIAASGTYRRYDSMAQTLLT